MTAALQRYEAQAAAAVQLQVAALKRAAEAESWASSDRKHLGALAAALADNLEKITVDIHKNLSMSHDSIFVARARVRAIMDLLGDIQELTQAGHRAPPPPARPACPPSDPVAAAAARANGILRRAAGRARRGQGEEELPQQDDEAGPVLGSADYIDWLVWHVRSMLQCVEVVVEMKKGAADAVAELHRGYAAAAAAAAPATAAAGGEELNDSGPGLDTPRSAQKGGGGGGGSSLLSPAAPQTSVRASSRVQERRQLLIHALRRMQRVKTSESFHCWRDFVGQAAATKLLMSRAVLRISRMAVAKSFSQLHAHTRRRLLIKRTVLRMQVRQRDTAFPCASAATLPKTDALLVVPQGMKLSQLFGDWFEHAQLSRADRSQREQESSTERASAQLREAYATIGEMQESRKVLKASNADLTALHQAMQAQKQCAIEALRAASETSAQFVENDRRAPGDPKLTYQPRVFGAGTDANFWVPGGRAMKEQWQELRSVYDTKLKTAYSTIGELQEDQSMLQQSARAACGTMAGMEAALLAQAASTSGALAAEQDKQAVLRTKLKEAFASIGELQEDQSMVKHVVRDACGTMAGMEDTLLSQAASTADLAGQVSLAASEIDEHMQLNASAAAKLRDEKQQASITALDSQSEKDRAARQQTQFTSKSLSENQQLTRLVEDVAATADQIVAHGQALSSMHHTKDAARRASFCADPTNDDQLLEAYTKIGELQEDQSMLKQSVQAACGTMEAMEDALLAQAASTAGAIAAEQDKQAVLSAKLKEAFATTAEIREDQSMVKHAVRDACGTMAGMEAALLSQGVSEVSLKQAVSHCFCLVCFHCLRG